MKDSDRNNLIAQKGYHFATDKEEAFYMLGIKDCEELLLKNNPFCPYCGKYKTSQGNGIMHQLCECGGSSTPLKNE